MKTTRYFEEQVLRKRPYVTRDACMAVVSAPLHREVQSDRRIRLWGAFVDPHDGKTRYLRVIVLEDGETLHNAFYDRDFSRRAR